MTADYNKKKDRFGAALRAAHNSPIHFNSSNDPVIPSEARNLIPSFFYRCHSEPLGEESRFRLKLKV